MKVIITTQGLNKLAQATSISPLTLTQFALGDGGGESIDPVESMTSLVNEKFRSELNIRYEGGDHHIIEAVLRANSNIPVGFTARELGVFDKSRELIMICSIPDQYIPGSDENEGLMECIFKIKFQHANAENTSIEVKEQAFATVSAVEALRVKHDAEMEDLEAVVEDSLHELLLSLLQKQKYLAEVVNFNQKSIAESKVGQLFIFGQPKGEVFEDNLNKYAMCNGKNGTPNLIDVFIKGASSAVNENRYVQEGDYNLRSGILATLDFMAATSYISAYTEFPESNYVDPDLQTANQDFFPIKDKDTSDNNIKRVCFVTKLSNQFGAANNLLPLTRIRRDFVPLGKRNGNYRSTQGNLEPNSMSFPIYLCIGLAG